MQRVKERLTLVLPLTLFLILALLYLNTRSFSKTLIVMLAVPFSAVGAIWFLYALGYNMSAGVWVGLIALMGVDAETGVFMLLYLDLAYEEARRLGRLTDLAGLREAIRQGAVRRIRPKVMTVACLFLGLVPILWSTGTGADVMKRIAAPPRWSVASSLRSCWSCWCIRRCMRRGRCARCSRLSDNEDVADAIVRDPEIMHGVPVFRGTRVPVQTLFEYLEGGDTIESFLEGFPTVPRALALEALEEAKQLLLARD